ncbi:MAG: T9SS type A sorting domain-containing protein [Bacteroidia bacterium]
MKKYFLVCFLYLQLSNIHSQTSKYFPFPDSNAVWCDSLCGVVSTCFSGDTVIGSNTYHKLVRGGYYYQIHPGGSCDPNIVGVQPYTYKGALRQDTAQRKVYFFAAGYPTESLLCDFMLNVGDTVRTWNTINHPNSVVTAIDSILIGNQYRKRWWVQMGFCSNWNTQIIEGIGSAYGLLDQRTLVGGACTTYGKLYCFSQNDQTLYPYYSPSAGCTKVIGINTYFSPENLSVYPNPTGDHFFVDANTIEKLNIDLFDINGKHVLNKIVNNKSTIDVKNLENGIYIMTIKSAGITINKKLVIVR